MKNQNEKINKKTNTLLLGHIYFFHQQAVSGMYSNTSGEGVMDGERVQIGGVTVSPALVHISTPMKVHRVSTLLLLLTHVFQLHLRQVDRREVPQNLNKIKNTTNNIHC